MADLGTGGGFPMAVQYQAGAFYRLVFLRAENSVLKARSKRMKMERTACWEMEASSILKPGMTRTLWIGFSGGVKQRDPGKCRGPRLF